MSTDDIRAALEHLKSGGLRLGAGLDAAHEICQRHEGDDRFDWMHALIHRIEGDQGNADYWYRRSGHPRHPGTVAEEWESIRGALLGD